jgi:hypothetical protein
MRWLISASVFHIQEPVGLRLFPPFHPPAGLVHPWMPKDFIYVQDRGNAIELDQTAPLTHLNIDYPHTAKHTLRGEP